MKTLARLCAPRARRTSRTAAFTLVEIMITVVITVIVIGAVLASYMYGMRMFQLVKPKLSSSDDARHTISKMVQEIRSAWMVSVGTGTHTSFTPASLGGRQEGNAVEIYPVANRTNIFSRYYLDAKEGKLKRVSSGDPDVQVLAHDVTNAVPFTAEDHLGNVLTNSSNNRVIGLTLQFCQVRYPLVAVGPGKFYDFYQLRTKITRRAIL